MYYFQEQFYQVMTRLGGSRAVSTQKDARKTQVTNGLIVSKRLKKGPEIINLQ
jgi:hypothetical protein